MPVCSRNDARRREAAANGDDIQQGNAHEAPSRPNRASSEGGGKLLIMYIVFINCFNRDNGGLPHLPVQGTQSGAERWRLDRTICAWRRSSRFQTENGRRKRQTNGIFLFMPEA
jgi:hypothetical protein